MRAIEQNRHFQNEFALFLMPSAVAAFWDKYLDNVNECNEEYYRIRAREEFLVFKHRALNS